MSFAPGSRLGPFEIRERVDLPGFGEVYAARDDQNDRDVAIHVLRTNAAQDEDVRDRFEQHVRAAAARTQPNPLAIHLIGADPQAVYVVSDPIQPPPAPPIAPVASMTPVVRRDVPAPRRLRVAAAALLIIVLVIAVIATRDGEPERGPADASSTTERAPAAPRPGTSAPPLYTERIETSEPVAREPAPPVEAPRTARPEAPEPPEPREPAERPAPVERPEPIARPAVPVPREPIRPILPPVDTRNAMTLVTEATVRATEFDLDGALSLLEVAAGRGDAFARIAVLYVRGLIGARDAFREGGDPKALTPVQASISALGDIARGRPGAAEIARLVLHAGAAAAQSERDEMRLYIDSAIQMESLQLAAGQGGAPLVSASELAGDFWLQVSRYEEARRAYTEAAERVGFTLRSLSGLARAARRLNDMPAACTAYRRLADVWGARPGLPVEIAEARAYLGGCPR